MKKNILALFYLFITGISSAQTIVPAGTVSGVWSQSGSPYLVQGAIMIANGTSLTIDPGVRVEFQGNYKFLVLGEITAIGNTTDSITFTTADTSIGWLGIQFDNTNSSNDTSRFSFCNIQYCKTSTPGTNVSGFYFNNFSKAVISYSTVSDCSNQSATAGGATLINSSPAFYNNIFLNNNGNSGGAIFCNCTGNSPIISGNAFFNNRASVGQYSYGGAIYCNGGSPLISFNLISNNSASTSGGGIYCYESGAIITSNIINYNTAQIGGGIFSMTGPPNTIINYNFICNNFSSVRGGGLQCEHCTISNCVIVNNESAGDGGGFSSGSLAAQQITNTTIANNLAQYGGGVHCRYSNPIFRNCIFWNDSATISGDEFFLFDEPSDPDFYYCNIMGSSTAFGLNPNIFYTGNYTNNLNSDPLITMLSGGIGTGFDGISASWMLLPNSPCINAGDPSGTYPAIDIAGMPRVSNGIIDMGAFETLISGMNDLNNKSHFEISPNPVTTTLNIWIDHNDYINIYNAKGEIVLQKNFANCQREKVQLNVTSLSPGIYLLRAGNNATTFVKQ